MTLTRSHLAVRGCSPLHGEVKDRRNRLGVVDELSTGKGKTCSKPSLMPHPLHKACSMCEGSDHQTEQNQDSGYGKERPSDSTAASRSHGPREARTWKTSASAPETDVNTYPRYDRDRPSETETHCPLHPHDPKVGGLRLKRNLFCKPCVSG
jgi:hypothetical protein